MEQVKRGHELNLPVFPSPKCPLFTAIIGLLSKGSSISVVSLSLSLSDFPVAIMEAMAEAPEERAAVEKKNWIIELKEKLRPSNPWRKEELWKKQSIYKIPAYIKDMNTKAYTPQMVSIGPYHHGKPHLTLMEEHKRRALIHFLDRSNKPIEDFGDALEAVADELMSSYEQLEEKWKDKNAFLQLMLLDGTFLIEILREAVGIPEDYALDDPIFSLRGILNTFHYMVPDLLMVENQLPLVVIERLLAIEGDRAREENYRYTNELVFKFVLPSGTVPQMGLGLHLLDLLRKAIIQDPHKRPHREDEHRLPALAVRSAAELHGAGIQFKKSRAHSLKDITFKDGILCLPVFIVEGSTESIYLNMIAFERLSPSAILEVSSYIAFMYGLISSVDDVVFLRTEGIIETTLGSDVAVAKLTKELAKDVFFDPSSSLCEVRDLLNEHYKRGMRRWSRRLRDWRKNLRESYFKNPWTFISLVAAVILLLLTVAQTYYSIISFYKS